MSLDVSAVKRLLQDHLQEGLLLVVGSGQSIAEGLPGMGELATHLRGVVPTWLVHSPDNEWDRVAAALLAGRNLEDALSNASLLQTTLDFIIGETASLIRKAERAVMSQGLNGTRVLSLTPFLTHLFKSGKSFHVVTPNYDRLIELAAEAAGIGVDSRFFGYLFGCLGPKRSADCYRESYLSHGHASFRSLPCLHIYKPHGSLDWFEVNSRIIRFPLETERVPAIVTPGFGKYKESFRRVFEDQRAAGNRSIAAAKRLMFIGYGFGDYHLEQYLCPNSIATRPTVIVTKELSTNARNVITNSKDTNVLALCADPTDDARTRVIASNGSQLVINEQLWNLSGFNAGIL